MSLMNINNDTFRIAATTTTQNIKLPPNLSNSSGIIIYNDSAALCLAYTSKGNGAVTLFPAASLTASFNGQVIPSKFKEPYLKNTAQDDTLNICLSTGTGDVYVTIGSGE